MSLTRTLLFPIVLALLAALAAHFLLAQDPGLVLVRWRGHDYTSTVLYASWIAIGAVLALWLAWTLLASPFRAWGRHRDRRHRARIGDGLEALHQGHYAKAEKLLVQAAADEAVEAPARIGAAQAALATGEADGARGHLDALAARHPELHAIAVAELALAEDRPTDALVALDASAAQPLPPRGLALRAEALARSGRATAAYGLLGTLRKQRAWTGSELADRELRWAEAALREGDDNAFAAHWEALPRTLKAEPAIVATYATRAAEAGWDEAACRSIERALDTRWDERLAALYGRLPMDRVEQRRAQAGRWLQAHPGSFATRATLARLAQAQGDHARAEALWREALAHGGSSADWEALGEACTARGDHARAALCYANALRAGRGEAVAPIPADDPAPVADAAMVEIRDEHGLPRLADPDPRDLA